MGLALCLIAFVGTVVCARRSLVAGLGAVLATGYLYGILRANFLDTFCHFLFDSSVLGLYLSLLMRLPPALNRQRLWALRQWVLLLMGWATIMFMIPLQHPLIQLVGLRGNAFLLPFILLGGCLSREDGLALAIWLAALNLFAFAFAGAEYILGIQPFFPVNAVTEIIYKSGDVAEFTAYRIPACFANAHSFAGAMVGTIPWLVGAWIQPRGGWWRQVLLGAAVVAAALGVFMSAARLHMIILLLLIVLTTLSIRMRGFFWIIWLALLAVIGYIVSGEERLQRLATLNDTGFVMERLEGSVNMNFLELLAAYPMGNGMGAGGTSLPFFLQDLLVNPVGLENEYSRILLEQGLPGLILWLAFIVYVFLRRPAYSKEPWLVGRRLMWYLGVIGFASSVIGTGLMTAIPQSTLFFLSLGFALATPRTVAAPVRIKQDRPEPEEAHAKLLYAGVR